MADLRAKLAELLHSERAQTLAEDAPIALLALVSSSVIGVAIGAPTFAAAGLGMVLTSLATNIASTFIYEVMRPGSDDEQRRKAIRDGLQAKDPQVTALVADTLAALGPQLAGALSDARQPRLLPALTDGMQRSGGVLAEVAPQLSAALADPHADWAALQGQVAQRISSVEMSMETTDDARMSNQEQRVENAEGPVKLVMKADGKSVQGGNRQTVIGATGASKRTPTAHQPAPTPNDPQHLHKLLAANIARLQVRELQRAQYGIDVPPYVKLEIDDLRAEVGLLRTQLGV